jgi:2-iminoacetate synthase
MIPFRELKEILYNNDRNFIESLAQKARETTIQYFGRAVSLYAPLYLSNYCDNCCLYCGFRQNKQVKRKKLTIDEIQLEMKKVSSAGIQNILLLTGESRSKSPVSYIKEAVQLANRYFASTGIEVYPMEVEEYRELFSAGVDGVTVYQETYNRQRYKELHGKGKKADYDYRYSTPERIARAGIRMINMGALLGLFDVVEDIYQLFLHLEKMERDYPGVEYAISFPRIIPINDSLDYVEVPDIMLIKLICVSRLLFPRVGINLSTRERAHIRDHALELGVTKISAASKTTVGGYSLEDESIKHPQFEVMDERSVNEIVEMLNERGFDPVFTDWRRIPNEAIAV